MLLKQTVKTIVNTVAPEFLHRRFIRINTLKEPEIALLPLLCARGATAIDIGANQGLYIHHLLPLAAKVVAFEPLIQMQKTLRRAYGEQIQLEPLALSNAPGTTEIRFPRGHFPLATLETANDLSAAQTRDIICQTIELRTLDSYRFAEVGLVKIDVEGHEEAVIQGAMETLRANAPSLIIEIEERHNKGAIQRVYDLLKPLGYVGFFLADGALQDFATFDVERDQIVDNVGPNGKLSRYVNNFIFVPAARAEALRAGAKSVLAKAA